MKKNLVYLVYTKFRTLFRFMSFATFTFYKVCFLGVPFITHSLLQNSNQNQRVQNLVLTNSVIELNLLSSLDTGYIGENHLQVV